MISYPACTSGGFLWQVLSVLALSRGCFCVKCQETHALSAPGASSTPLSRRQLFVRRVAVFNMQVWFARLLVALLINSLCERTARPQPRRAQNSGGDGNVQEDGRLEGYHTSGPKTQNAQR